MAAGYSSPYRHVLAYLTLFLITEYYHTKYRIHPIPSRPCPANNCQCHKHVPSTQIYCMSSLIWCQSNPQAGFIGIIYFLLCWMFFWQFLIAKHHANHLFRRDPEPLLHCLSPQGYFDVEEVAAVYCIREMIWSAFEFNFREFTLKISFRPIWRWLIERSAEMILVPLGWADRRRQDKNTRPDYD